LDRTGIEFLTVFNLPPVDFVSAAADAGCRFISCAVSGSPVNPAGRPIYNLTEDSALRREMKAALRDRGVSISLAECGMVLPGSSVHDRAKDLDALRELGAVRANVVSMDPDLGRTFDQYAEYCELAAAAGIDEVVTEFVPGLTVADLPTALAALKHVGKANFRLLVDAMHLFRSGSSVADLTAVDPARIGYVQLCDVPLVPLDPDYMTEAMTERRAPGKGELPLRDLLAVLSRDLVVGLEIPELARELAGVPIAQRLAEAVASTRALLESLPAKAG